MTVKYAIRTEATHEDQSVTHRYLDVSKWPLVKVVKDLLEATLYSSQELAKIHSEVIALKTVPETDESFRKEMIKSYNEGKSMTFHIRIELVEVELDT